MISMTASSNNPAVAMHQLPHISWVWALALTVCLYLFYTDNNDFLYYSHPDTPSKVEQVQSGEFNLKHPMLMIGTANIINALLDGSDDPQRIALYGRRISALFAAVAVALLSLAVWKLRGWPAGIASGIFVGAIELLYEYAHYFKEDSALLFGGALVVFTLTKLQEEARIRNVLFLGAACAVASSGKYIGIGSLLFAIPAVFIVTSNRSINVRRAWIGFIGTFFFVFSLLNIPLFLDPNYAIQQIDLEITKLMDGGSAKAGSEVPHGKFLQLYITQVPAVAWLLAIIGSLSIIRNWRMKRFAEWSILLFPLILLMVLSFSPKDYDRYLIPGIACVM